MNGDFGSRIKNLVKKWNGEHITKPQVIHREPEAFNHDLDTKLDQIIDEMKKQAWLATTGKFETEDEFLTILNNRTKNVLMAGNTPKFHQVKSSFERHCTWYKELTDITAQEVSHDYGSKRRFLLFRILTTMGIAAAALLMAIAANLIGYETAILKKIDEKPKTEQVIAMPMEKVIKNKPKSIENRVPKI